MREIKFRGLTEGGTWVYGDLINYENGRKAIIGRQLSAPGYLSVEGSRISPVKAEAIGQLTGLVDKNNVEIYEGDIVKMSDDGEVAVSTFHSGAFRFIGNNISWTYYRLDCEVIGNTHQNPELLEQNDE